MKQKGQQLTQRLRQLSRSKHRGGVHPNLREHAAAPTEPTPPAARRSKVRPGARGWRAPGHARRLGAVLVQVQTRGQLVGRAGGENPTARAALPQQCSCARLAACNPPQRPTRRQLLHQVSRAAAIPVAEGTKPDVAAYWDEAHQESFAALEETGKGGPAPAAGGLHGLRAMGSAHVRVATMAACRRGRLALMQSPPQLFVTLIPSIIPCRAALCSAARSARRELEALYDEASALAYGATRLPACYAALRRVLGEVKARMPSWRPDSMLDFGAGPGTATWAAQEVRRGGGTVAGTGITRQQ